MKSEEAKIHMRYKPGIIKVAFLILAILIFPCFAFTQTRLYLNLNTASTISPSFNAGWDVTTGAARYIMGKTKDGSTIANRTTGNSGAAAVRKCLADQWISDPLQAQTITGTFTGQVRFAQSSTTATTGQGFLYVRIINPNGSIATEVGNGSTTNLTTTLTNRTMISLNVGTLNITAGQRICVDLGWNYSSGTNTTRNCIISKGSSSATDLVVDNSTTAADNPWFQFSQTLLFEPSLTNSAIVDYGKTYVNITDGVVGGTINPGDVLEIRATLVVQKNLAGLHRAIDSISYFDTLSAGKGFGFVPGSLSLRTNEGKLVTAFTDSKVDSDPGWYSTAGPGTDTTIQMNMGIGASKTRGGVLRSNSRPSVFGGTCILMATFRVVVNAGYGAKINFGGGAFRYRDSVNGAFYKVVFPRDSLIVYQSPGACPDAVSATNVIGDEFNGTFGAPSGLPTYPQNRGTSSNTSYIYAPFGANAPQDYYYGVANNTSVAGTTNQTVPKSNSARVFGFWDITGDHTGAVNTGSTSKGNPPCNLSLPVSTTNPCGYMLAINSAYRTDVAFEYNATGACTDTYYEISAWFKNICYKCGCDSTGTGSGSAGYIPTTSGDSTGVRPNIAMEIDGIDYYTTGELVYQGLGGTQTGSDTLNKWVKRAFVFKTSSTQTGFKVTFRNNAPGGGGNDWAIDDISIRTCYPNMSYSPSANPIVCAGQTLTLSDTVRSYYNVYIYYKWQRSINAGVTWIDLAGASGIATTTWNGSSYQFVSSYTLPPTATTPSNNGNLYRMVVATNATNLAGASCNYSDNIPVTLHVNNCIDIDDDNDGIPDYVEFNNAIALQDANSNGIPNWNDPAYPGFVDNNSDAVNDNFDWGADADADGIVNFYDTDFWITFVDVNSDGVHDKADKDLDGIPNQYDLDSDNDGIPDTVESYGVDTNGDGLIDNYSDTDNDGFSQNVDANNTGVNGSGTGLGPIDFDGDSFPNYLDLDSDNDGVPDLVESGGVDANNNGMIDAFTDANSDGFADNYILVSALLKSGVDVSPVDGRADNWPNKNMDRDFRPNTYDLDSDWDGIVDVIEAGLPDANLNGIVDGTIGPNGWSTTVSALASLGLRSTDSDGRPDYLDIDSDADGIPDNIEGQTTAGYLLPTLTDADGDGLMSPYDNYPAVYGGTGIMVYDHDGDGTPDYRDLDTDGDGLIDRIEGNDFNLNGSPDDNVTPTGLDTDGDGLDNRFDSLNSVTNIKGTSYRMGNLGSFTGDAAPGSRTTVQKTMISQTDRDWRSVGFVLPVQFLNFTGIQNNNNVLLNWTIIADKEIDHFEIERSMTNTSYIKIKTITDPVLLHIQQSFNGTDNISAINRNVIYYRLKVIGKSGAVKYSNILVVRKNTNKPVVSIIPNPANDYVTIQFYADEDAETTIWLIDNSGRIIISNKQKVYKGFNTIQLNNLSKFSNAVYELKIQTGKSVTVKKLLIKN